MKIKDLPKDQGLGGVRFLYPGESQIYIWHSQWEKGVWAKKDAGSSRVFPLFCDQLSDALEWEVAQ